LITLGEGVSEGDAICLHADGKGYRAMADGSNQPCIGVAVEDGNASDQIRVHRAGDIEISTYSFATLGGLVYLSHSVRGGLTQTPPGTNIQVIGYALTATILVCEIQLPVGSILATTTTTTT
jgi:hypothetical protein